MSRLEFLLEVRSEEIPARMLAPATRELAHKLFEDLTTRGLGPTEIETGYTPRRLVVVLRGLPEKEPDRQEQVTGPPVSVAYKDDGSPTPALLGFAKRCGVEPEALEKLQTDKGEYLAATQEIQGRSASEVLAQMVPQFLTGLSWPKNMKWGSGVGPWVRPVHGVLALLRPQDGGDAQVVPFELFGVASSASTVGHPVLSPEPFEVEGADDYRETLRERTIEVDPAKRREALLTEMTRRAEAAGGTLVEDDDLLHTLAAMCGVPGVVEGRFDEIYLELPREVLITSLKDHQRAFTVEDDAGNLLPLFLSFMDRADDPVGRVAAGNEWVVAARLEDARFFYAEDQKVGLEARCAELDRLTFQVKLGSYAEKSERLQALAAALAESLGWQEHADDAREAARLAKADLSTGMVGEFSSLQGIMGGIYARDEGASEPVWQAIYDQYHPASTDDALPRGPVGLLLGLADRIDTLVGMYGLGLAATGSKDPFGLRRAAQAVVRMLFEAELALDLEAAVDDSRKLYGDKLDKSTEEILETLRPFLLDRVRTHLDRRGFAYDEIEAALAAGHTDLPDLQRRVAAVHEIRKDGDFLSVALSAKRIANILKDAEAESLDPERLEEPAEKALYEGYQGLSQDVANAVKDRDYLEGLRRVGELARTLDRFFEEVMVMAEDTVLRANRMALLRRIEKVILPIADLSELVVDKSAHR